MQQNKSNMDYQVKSGALSSTALLHDVMVLLFSHLVDT